MKSLQLKTKLLYLLISVAIGLVVIGLVGYFNLLIMKKNVDTLYFGSLLPLTELSSINTAYHHELESSVYRWKEGLIDDNTLATNITLGLQHVDQMWGSYLSHHKRPEELPYLRYTENQMEIMGRYFEEIRSLVGEHTSKSAISIVRLSDNTTSIHTTISRLISYEISSAKYERSILLTHHENSLKQLAVILGIILTGVLGFAWRIFTQIEIQQQQLVESTNALKHVNIKLEQASYTDSLTGIFNRRYFNLVYEREFKRAVRGGKSITFMMVDIDFFKQYNDTYGHLQGDIALKNVAHVLKTSLLRPGDFVFRLGGEEFGILITDTDCPNARQMAERIRFNVESLGMEHKANKLTATVTISIGAICAIPTESMNNEALLHSADTNLYAAKERGRNKVIFTSTLQ
ncbi:MAG: diguanylate cyclase [Sulfuricurvum sp.]|uniref:diguanylate cyclase n=1 Tax=Sulfuricurvum sp. TaxID=2025608 RepID=UPI00261E048E|nr:diguanylate cyclase [Sulfuricurvum sp.]MDD2829374.1 diguanylate cyclase [Sulfuricurvum sp.]MDD4949135.1 diguanylate cyclase [Sulfuricurvum sp.]